MSTTYMAAGITIVLALNSMSEAMRLREYRRPVCSPEQSCFYEAFGMVFALCDCPGEDRSCPQEEEHSIEHRGTMYSFCEARDIPLCKDGDISTSVKGIQTAVHCICPDQNELVQMPGEQKDRTNYVCRQPYHGIDDIVELKTTTVQQFSAETTLQERRGLWFKKPCGRREVVRMSHGVVLCVFVGHRRTTVTSSRQMSFQAMRLQTPSIGRHHRDRYPFSSSTVL